ncbi:TPA: hypothetical protein ACXEPX_005439, partial [Klebsiella pneumoniae]
GRRIPLPQPRATWPYPQGILYHPPAQITARGVTVLPVSLANGPPSFLATWQERLMPLRQAYNT